MTRPRGSKNTGYPRVYRDGVIDFWLAILWMAGRDADKGWHYATEMCRDAQLAGIYPKRNVNALEEAWWICEYLKGVME